MIRRIIDIFLALIGIVFMLPFFPFIALLIKLDSRGPIFYLGDRVGKDMKTFKMFKFRTMIETPVEVGESVSPHLDPRVSTFGRFLRRTKLNEVPQFINVLKGDMTFVGPRPEAPDLAELYPEYAKRIFSVKPGLVGPNQILGRNEEEKFPPGVDAKKYYIEEILPEKVKIDLDYIDNPSFFKDFACILLGVKVTLLGALNERHIKANRVQIRLFFADMLLSVLCFVIVEAMSARFLPHRPDISRIVAFLPAVLIIRAVCFFAVGMYNSLIRYISYQEIFRVLKGVTFGSLLLIVLGLIYRDRVYSGLPAIADWSLLILFMSGYRFRLKLGWERKHARSGNSADSRVLIFGAGSMGELAYRTLKTDQTRAFEVVGFIDDDPEKYGKRLDGIKVLGTRYHIDALARLHGVNEVILAMSQRSPAEVTKIMQICQEAGLRYRVFSPIRQVDEEYRVNSSVRVVELSDILPIKGIYMDEEMVQPIVRGKTVLINGSGGAMGLELCRRLLQLGCKKLILVDRYESYLTELASDLLNLFPRESIVPVLLMGDRIGPLKKAFETHRPSLVFHAAMKKYVPFFDVNEEDIVNTNYKRTFNLAKMATDNGCEFFVMISSVAAGNGDGIISRSLRISELSLQMYFKGSGTRLVIGRVCDIVENRGGIVSVMENQIRRREVVTLPSPEAQIHLLSKTSAVEFILQGLGETALRPPDQETTICETGSPVRFLDVARQLASLHGLKLGADVPVMFSDRLDHQVEMLQSTAVAASVTRGNITCQPQNGDSASAALEVALKRFVSFFNSFPELDDLDKETERIVESISASVESDSVHNGRHGLA
jgi:FlaA1/EpsC-like NDP-sugar epimerase/lipopolysaccharide/colanic/teichoic acid biosynthesis glycosyltransferase